MIHTPWRAACILILSLVLGISACSSSSTEERRLEELGSLAEVGDWKEIETRIELLESEGVSGASLDYFMGWAQLSQDEDRPATQRFESAVAADSGLALKVASHYRAAAQRDLEGGWQKRAAQRMWRGYRLDGITEMGVLGPEVSDLIFNEKDYLGAIPVLRQLLRGEAEEQMQQRWTFRLGLALELSGLKLAGLDVYRQYGERWPRARATYYQNYVFWRQGVLLLDFADERMEHGDCEGAITLFEEILSLRSHAEHRGEAYYRMGLCLEDLNRIDEARECYRNVLQYPSGEGGGADEQARERLRALADHGGR